jgi:hypothetical protein
MEYRGVTSKQRGALGEALVTAHRYEIYEVLTPWIAEDLREHEGVSIPSEDSLTIRKRALGDFEEARRQHEDKTWVPDTLFEVSLPVEEGEVRPTTYNYLAEVKTGTSSTLGENQREVMEALEASDEKVIPLRMRVDIAKLPEEYGIHITRIHGRH